MRSSQSLIILNKHTGATQTEDSVKASPNLQYNSHQLKLTSPRADGMLF